MPERAAPTRSRRARRLDRHGACRQPWFAWVHLYEPHFPYAPPEPFASQYRRRAVPRRSVGGRRRARPAAVADPRVGGLPAGRWSSSPPTTGKSLGEHGEMTHGLFAYDGTLRVPLDRLSAATLRAEVRSPGRCATSTFSRPCSDAVGSPSAEALDGRSLLAMASGAPSGTGGHLLRVAVGVVQSRVGAAHGVVARLAEIHRPADSRAVRPGGRPGRVARISLPSRAADLQQHASARSAFCAPTTRSPCRVRRKRRYARAACAASAM